MRIRRFIFQSLLYYRWSYLGVFLGAILGAMVLLGALFAGDSVTASLKRISAMRTGQATHIMTAGDRFFRQALAGDLAEATRGEAAPVLLVKGSSVNPSNQQRVNQVQLVGVTEAFWGMALEPIKLSLSAEKSEVAVNALVAVRLGLGEGDTLIVRLQKPGILAGNAPVAGAASRLVSMRCTVKAVVGDGSFGRFSLETTQVQRPSVFFPIELLQEEIGYEDRANLILCAWPHTLTPALSQGERGISIDGEDLEAALQEAVTLADYELSLEWLERAGVFELKSNRVFIDPEIAAAIQSEISGTQPFTTYLVNEFKVGDRTTPYSTATAVGSHLAPFLPEDLGDGEIAFNQWLAQDLNAELGDEVEITYFQTGDGGSISEVRERFILGSVVPMSGLAADPAWMPDFPGISESESPADWDPGLPLDLGRIRSKDEDYWDAYRGTPKAYLNLATGIRLWSTRWGDFTAMRFSAPWDNGAELTAAILQVLRPQMNQMMWQDFGAAGLQAAQSPVDFGGLFAGMSFFLILASLGLVAMLFQFSLLQRNRESALLGSVGLPGRKLLGWRLSEGLVILMAGCLIGLPLAMYYSSRILKFLETIWAGEATAPTFVFHAKTATILGGGMTFLILSLLSLWLAVRKQARPVLSQRLGARAEERIDSGRTGRVKWTAGMAGVIGLGAVFSSGSILPAQGAFYLAGFALLVAGLAVCRTWLGRKPKMDGTAEMDPNYLARLNLSARPARSLTVVGLIASAVFMVLSVASFRKHVGAEWREPGSGTGGYAFLVETTVPLHPPRDWDTADFEIFSGMQSQLGSIIPMRQGAGDNANCFNLNTATLPQLLGVKPEAFAQRNAFQLSQPDPDLTGSGWSMLRTLTPEGRIPALVDETTLLWAIKRKVGDVLVYRDENGRDFEVRIVGTVKDSIFQGYVLVDERLLLQRFPYHPGYSLFLLDAVGDIDLEVLRNRIEAAGADAGASVGLTRDILKSFHQIENTYIAIFNVLGALGVILGSLGLAIVVARSIQERSGEFSVMSAIGIERRLLAKLVFSEYSRLVAWGLVIGVLASLLSIVPNLSALPVGPTLLLVVSLLAGIVLLNLICGRFAFNWASRHIGSNPAKLDA